MRNRFPHRNDQGFIIPLVVLFWVIVASAKVLAQTPSPTLRTEEEILYEKLKQDKVNKVLTNAKAIRGYKKVIDLARRNKRSEIDPLISKSFFKLGLAYDDTNQTTAAFQAFRTAMNILEKRGAKTNADKLELGLLNHSLGRKYSQLASFNLAKDHLQEAVRYWTELNETSKWAGSLNTLAVVYTNLGDFDAADIVLRKALSLRLNDPTCDLESVVKVRINIADNNLKRGLLENAKLQIDYAMSDYETYQPETKIYLLKNLADFHVQTKALDSAKACYQRALLIANGSSGDRNVGIIEKEYAELLMGEGEYSNALTHLQRALQAFVPTFKSNDPLQNPERKLWDSEPWLYVLFEAKARAYQGLNDPEIALNNYETAFSYIDHLRQGFNTSDSKMFFSKFAYGAYENAIRLAKERFEKTRDKSYLNLAFKFMEQSKTNEILESLRQLQGFNAFGIPNQVLTRLRLLDSELAAATLQKKATLITDLEAQKRVLRAILKRNYPKFYKLTDSLQLATPDSVRQSLLIGDAVLLEYFLGESSIFIFAIDKDSVYCTERPRERAFDLAVSNLIQSVSVAPTYGDDYHESYQNFTPNARTVYHYLLEPVFAGRALPKHIIVVPDGRLALIPFECLLTTNVTEEVDFETLPYLIRQSSIRYGHSATTLQQQIQHRPTRKLQTLLALSPAYSKDSLPHAHEEAEAICNLFGDNTKWLDGTFATEAQLVELAREYQILHFAAHAEADSLQPMLSRIRLLPDTLNDGNLHAWEIMRLNLQAEMAVLSACQTGNGKIQKGEGVMSIARAFFVAGCPTVVMSLWDLDDGTTAELVEDYYRNLKKGLAPDEALQAAKLQALDLDDTEDDFHAHPFYWASMVVVGSNNLDLGGNYGLMYALCVAGLCLVIGVVIKVRSRRKS